MNKKIESEICGKAVAVFGGKIGGGIQVGTINETNIIGASLDFYELKNNYEIGETVDENIKDLESQISLIFTDVKSIDAVKKWLDKTREVLLKKQCEMEKK